MVNSDSLVFSTGPDRKPSFKALKRKIFQADEPLVSRVPRLCQFAKRDEYVCIHGHILLQATQSIRNLRAANQEVDKRLQKVSGRACLKGRDR